MDEVRAEMHYVYFALSIKNNKVYVGCTSIEPEKRVHQHNQGSNIWSTHNRPLKLIYFEEYLPLADARKRELWYKTGFGKKIKKLIVQEIVKGP